VTPFPSYGRPAQSFDSHFLGMTCLVLTAPLYYKYGIMFFHSRSIAPSFFPISRHFHAVPFHYARLSGFLLHFNLRVSLSWVSLPAAFSWSPRLTVCLPLSIASLWLFFWESPPSFSLPRNHRFLCKNTLPFMPPKNPVLGFKSRSLALS